MRFPALAAIFFVSVLVSVLFAASYADCTRGFEGLSAEEKARLKDYVLDSAPADIPHRIDVNFDNKVHLIGYDFRPESARPGQQVRLTFWWRCDASVDNGWMLFTHTRDEGNGNLGILDYDGPLREQRESHQLLGPDRWEKGKVYVDQQTYNVPHDVVGPEVTVLVGVWKGTDRLHILSGPNLGDNRAVVGKIRIGIGAKTGDAQDDTPSRRTPSTLLQAPRLPREGQ